jgi:Alpha-N-acetylglucosaminidase (NAGLU) N-terminal domain
MSTSQVCSIAAPVHDQVTVVNYTCQIISATVLIVSVIYRIQGTTGVELSSGLHWYLKYWCGVHISWNKTGGVQLGSVPPPGSLPRVDKKGVKIVRPVPWSYYQNVVTSSCKLCTILSTQFLHRSLHVPSRKIRPV